MWELRVNIINIIISLDIDIDDSSPKCVMQ